MQMKKELYEQMLRVNHAGEYGAQYIYSGQIKYTKNKKLQNELKHIAEEEKVHLDYFEKLILKERVRPTVMNTVWKYGGFSMGAVTALLGKDYVLACTEAVEEEIVKHYRNQLDAIDDVEKKNFKKTIKKFLDDEDKHRSFGSTHQNKSLRIRAFKELVRLITQTAINISQKY